VKFSDIKHEFMINREAGSSRDRINVVVVVSILSRDRLPSVIRAKKSVVET
jgi:hypothetical protein